MKDYSAEVPGAGGYAPAESSIGLIDVYQFFRSNVRVIALFAAASLFAAMIYLMFAKPTFVATASVLIEAGRSPDTINLASQPYWMVDQTRVESQIEVVKSNQIASSVISSLDLHHHPEFNGSKSWVADVMTWIAPSGFAQSDDQDEDPAEELVIRKLVVQFGKQLSVRRIGQSSVIEIAFASHTPETSASVANAVAQAYLHEAVRTKSQFAQQQAAWLSERLDSLREKTFEATRAAERFRLRGDGSTSQDARAKLEELESLVRSHRKVFDDFQQQYMHVLQKVSYPEPDARIVSSANIPLAKNSPRTGLVLGFALVFGAFIGTSYALLRTATDRTLDLVKQLNASGLACVGAIRDFDGDADRRIRKSGARPPATPNDQRTMLRQILTGHIDERARADFRKARTLTSGLSSREKPKWFGLVGFRDGDGVTTVAANLAYEYARFGARTLLVDTSAQDVSQGERPPIQRHGPPGMNVTGLLTLVLCPLNEQLRGIDHLLEQIATFVKEAEQPFECVIVDLPALSSSGRWRSLTAFVHEFVLVLDYGKTTAEDVHEAVFQLNSEAPGVSAVILNRAPERVRSHCLSVTNSAKA